MYGEMAENDTERAFIAAYEDPIYWGKEYKGTSGSGSSLKNAKPYVDFLQKFIKEHKIQSVVDAGCGDWQFSRHIDWSGIEYVGFDIVPKVIRANQKKYRTPNIHFFKADFTTMNFSPADLLVCKDVLQHLPNREILLFLKQLPKFKYCLITNDVHPVSLSSDNLDIRPGYYRTLDLTEAPFKIRGKKVLTYRSGIEIKQTLLIENLNEPHE